MCSRNQSLALALALDNSIFFEGGGLLQSLPLPLTWSFFPPRNSLGLKKKYEINEFLLWKKGLFLNLKTKK